MGLFEIIIAVVGFYWVRAYMKEKKKVEAEERDKKEVSLD